MKLKLNAYAKINLLLDIVGRRDNGYHDLFMIMQSVSLHDIVTLTVDQKKHGIVLTCSKPGVPTDASNTAYKAAKAFFKFTGIRPCGVQIDLVKNIPHAAGLAGGSADAAAVLYGLNKIFETKLSDQALTELGLLVGSDVPYCIFGGTKLVQGVGDVINKLKSMPACSIVLAKPKAGVSTAAAYQKYDTDGKQHTPQKFPVLCAVQNSDLEAISAGLANVFEQFIEVPQRVEIKRIMLDCGALGTCMSGSGPTVFGLFAQQEAAEKAAEVLRQQMQDVFVCRPVPCGCKIVKKYE